MTGTLTAIIGPMFAGKTSKLLEMEYAYAMNNKTEIYKPIIDTRYSTDSIVSHDGKKRLAIPIDDSYQFGEIVLTNKPKYAFLDEAQFFDDGLVDCIDVLLSEDISIIFSALNTDYQNNPFKFKGSQRHIGELIAKADDIIKLYAKCQVCRQPASKTYRKIEDTNLVVIGGTGIYEPRCNEHYSAKFNHSNK